MSDKLKRTIIGAVIAVALAAGVSYGLISQQTADKLQQQADQTLTTDGQPANAPSDPSAAPAPGQPTSDTRAQPPGETGRPSPAPASRP